MIIGRAPLAITIPVRSLCGQINPDSKPAFISIKPESDCEPGECFKNVMRKVQCEGGRIQFGWSIWEWPLVYIEAEHHAVYEPPAGQPWLDITPSELPKCSKRLFLPEDTAPYDFENEGVRRDNIRMALKDDPQIEEFFLVSSAYNELMNSLPGVGKITVTPSFAAKLEQLQVQRARLQYELMVKYLSSNDKCFCGSRLKFRCCHGIIERAA